MRRSLWARLRDERGFLSPFAGRPQVLVSYTGTTTGSAPLDAATLFSLSGGSWTITVNTPVTVRVKGIAPGGGGGGYGTASGFGGQGGGGGAMDLVGVDVVLVPNISYTLNAPAGGALGTPDVGGVTPADLIFSIVSSTVYLQLHAGHRGTAAGGGDGAGGTVVTGSGSALPGGNGGGGDVAATGGGNGSGSGVPGGGGGGGWTNSTLGGTGGNGGTGGGLNPANGGDAVGIALPSIAGLYGAGGHGAGSISGSATAGQSGIISLTIEHQP